MSELLETWSMYPSYRTTLIKIMVPILKSHCGGIGTIDCTYYNFIMNQISERIKLLKTLANSFLYTVSYFFSLAFGLTHCIHFVKLKNLSKYFHFEFLAEIFTEFFNFSFIGVTVFD